MRAWYRPFEENGPWWCAILICLLSQKVALKYTHTPQKAFLKAHTHIKTCKARKGTSQRNSIIEEARHAKGAMLHVPEKFNFKCKG